jgi:hypothetical protein
MRRSIEATLRGAALLALVMCFGCDLQGISMDVIPGSDDNIVGVEDTNRLIPVALLGADTFSLAAIDPASLAFGPAGATIARETASPTSSSSSAHATRASIGAPPRSA